MNRLHVYTVHIDPTLPHPYEEAHFVEEGFSWTAFIFGALWGIYHRLWLFSAIIVGVNALIMMLAHNGITTAATVCIQLAWRTLVGYMGNDWIRRKLKSRGYITADIVTGDSQLRAEQRFFDRYFSANKPAFCA